MNYPIMSLLGFRPREAPRILLILVLVWESQDMSLCDQRICRSPGWELQTWDPVPKFRASHWHHAGLRNQSTFPFLGAPYYHWTNVSFATAQAECYVAHTERRHEPPSPGRFVELRKTESVRGHRGLCPENPNFCTSYLRASKSALLRCCWSESMTDSSFSPLHAIH